VLNTLLKPGFQMYSKTLFALFHPPCLLYPKKLNSKQTYENERIESLQKHSRTKCSYCCWRLPFTNYNGIYYYCCSISILSFKGNEGIIKANGLFGDFSRAQSEWKSI